MLDLVFVFGPESNGTRLITRLFIASGYWGVDGHEQPSVDKLPKYKKKVVIRRSVPHGENWHDFLDQYKKAIELGHDPRIVVPLRNPIFAAQSAVDAGHVEILQQALKEQRDALVSIIDCLPTGKLEFVTYESLITDGLAAVKHLGITKVEQITNQNRKYYE